MKILAFAASNSKQSINKQLVTYAVSLAEGAETEVIDLNDYDMPLFSVDTEASQGIPAQAHQFLEKIEESDALVVSFAEHNGSYTVAYKNIFDWTSRIGRKVYGGKPVVLLATSPGPGGAKNVLAAAEGSFPHFGAEVKASVSVPSFNENFDVEKGEISNGEMKAQLVQAVAQLK